MLFKPTTKVYRLNIWRNGLLLESTKQPLCTRELIGIQSVFGIEQHLKLHLSFLLFSMQTFHNLWNNDEATAPLLHNFELVFIMLIITTLAEQQRLHSGIDPSCHHFAISNRHPKLLLPVTHLPYLRETSAPPDPAAETCSMSDP